MAAEIEKHFDTKVALVRSGGGVFEISNNNQLIFSKRATGRFPSAEEIIDKLKN